MKAQPIARIANNMNITQNNYFRILKLGMNALKPWTMLTGLNVKDRQHNAAVLCIMHNREIRGLNYDR